MAQHRITVGEELRYDADVKALHGLSNTYAPISGSPNYVATLALPAASGGDDTAAIQAVLDVASARAPTTFGAVVRVTAPQGQGYKACGLTIGNNVDLDLSGSRISANANGTVVTFTGSYSCLRNATLFGNNGGGFTCSGVTVNTGMYTNSITDCRFNFFTGRAIYDQGIATRIVHIMAQNCLSAAASLVAYTGVLELANTDAWVSDCEITASRYPANGMSTSGFACALSITGANNMVTNVVAETSDHGVYLGPGSTQTLLMGVRGELNYGHGWVIAGGGGRAIGCHALRNSQAGASLYDGFHATAGGWNFIGPYSESGGGNPKQNYGIWDGQTSQSAQNRWVSPTSAGDNIPFFATNSTITAYSLPNAHGFLRQSGTSSIFAGLFTRITMQNGSATNVTSITNGVNGQELIVRGDGNTTVVNGATLVTLSGANLLLANNTFYRFIRHEGVWYQI